MKRILLPFFLLLICAQANAQPPNDNPIGAVNLPVYAYGPVNPFTSSSTVNATYTTTPPNATAPSVCGCSSAVPATPRDVWFKFNSGSSYSNFLISINATSYFGTPGYARIYDDTTAAGVPILCRCSANSTTPLADFGFGGLAPNTDYYVAISAKVATSGFWGPFDIKVEGDNSPLPITLDYLNLKQNEEGNLIDWRIETYYNLSSVFLERKNEATNSFTTIYQMEEINSHDQTFIDRKAPLGKNNYRIVAVDIDGKKTYSTEKSITNHHKNHVELYPNPSYDTDELKITRKHFTDVANIQIFNSNGILVLQKKINSTQQIIRLSETVAFAKGIYIVKYKSVENDYPETFKWVKM